MKKKKNNEISEYKCPNCSAPLSYSPKSTRLECAACGSSFTVERISFQDRNIQEVESFDWKQYKKDLSQKRMKNTAVFTCQSCGAKIEADTTTGATRCPYCDNNVVLSTRFQGGLRPNAIIPFRITPRELPSAVRRFYRGKWLLPRGFFSDNHLGQVQGVYVPFWLFDCSLEGGANLEGHTTRFYTDGSYDCTEHSYYLLERDGLMAFAKIPVDGSEKMPNDLMDSIEPFDYSQMVPFQESYLVGFVADRFDQDPDKSLKRASKRLLSSAEAVLMGSCSGYSDVKVRSNRMQLTDSSVKYILLPVYLFHCEYKGKQYRYAVNGQTGKVVGELPISTAKTVASFLIPFAGMLGLWTAFITWLTA